MNDWFPNTNKLSPKAKVPFSCSRCGKCCRHIKQSVCIEPPDAFRITKYLRDNGYGISEISEFVDKYTEPVIIDESGYPTLMLKVKDPDDSCIFLDGNQCMIHSVNPRACRTYPFIAGPGDDGDLAYPLSKENPHHFCGKSVQTKTWFKQRLSAEDREFIRLEFDNAVEIAKLLRRAEDKLTAEIMFIEYKYLFYDLDQPFLEQYKDNHDALISQLTKISK